MISKCYHSHIEKYISETISGLNRGTTMVQPWLSDGKISVSRLTEYSLFINRSIWVHSDSNLVSLANHKNRALIGWKFSSLVLIGRNIDDFFLKIVTNLWMMKNELQKDFFYKRASWVNPISRKKHINPKGFEFYRYPEDKTVNFTANLIYTSVFLLNLESTSTSQNKWLS